jgi:hypothetical protein
LSVTGLSVAICVCAFAMLWCTVCLVCLSVSAPFTRS